MDQNPTIEQILEAELNSKTFAVGVVQGLSSITIFTAVELGAAAKADIQKAAVWHYGPSTVNYQVRTEAEVQQFIAEQQKGAAAP